MGWEGILWKHSTGKGKRKLPLENKVTPIALWLSEADENKTQAVHTTWTIPAWFIWNWRCFCTCTRGGESNLTALTRTNMQLFVLCLFGCGYLHAGDMEPQQLSFYWTFLLYHVCRELFFRVQIVYLSSFNLWQ